MIGVPGVQASALRRPLLKLCFVVVFTFYVWNLDAESTDYFKVSLLFRELRVLRSRLQPRVDEVLNTWTFRCDWAPGRSVDQANACYLPNVYTVDIIPRTGLAQTCKRTETL